MPRTISTIIGVSPEILEGKGVFNTYVDLDSHLHIDPSLLKNTKIKEFKGAHDDFEEHFRNVLKLVKGSKKENDALWNRAWQMLQFEEEGNTAIGYSRKGTRGSAIGKKLALKILRTTREIVDAGIDDPVIFELVGIIEENIGADRISDMTISIIFERFLVYTERVCAELEVKTIDRTIRGHKYSLPVDPRNGEYIVFLPKKLLNGLPIAMDWSEIDRVCQYNDELRKKLNKLIGSTWKRAVKDVPKSRLKEILIENPEAFKDIIDQYKKKDKSSYDFKSDPLGEIIWGELSKDAPKKYPLNLRDYNPITSDNILEVVQRICNHFKTLIEDNGWFEHLYDSKIKQKKERAPQKLFYGVAEAYCEANNLSLDRETDAGIGSLDFKISQGFDAKVTVEVKYSTNTSLVKGYVNQLPAYNRAEKATYSIYLVIKTKNSSASIRRLQAAATKQKLKKERVPEIIVIDGQWQQSASKRK
jgi:hypothetical protein